MKMGVGNRVFNTKVVEELYKVTNDDLSQWTKFFEHRARSANIFFYFHIRHPIPSRDKAVTVGTQWHRFSTFMPRFLCQAAAQVSDNEKRHYVIQTAYEELGMKRADEIHPDMFWEAASTAGATKNDCGSVSDSEGIGRHLEDLWNTLIDAKGNDPKILGLLLGLEIPAVENIETIFSSLAHNQEVEQKLQEGKFFSLHRKIEIEHVNLTVSNFLRFCKSENERLEFMEGFDYAVVFWVRFWETVSDMLCFKEEKSLTSA